MDNKGKPVELTVEAVDEMIKSIVSEVNDVKGREQSREFRRANFSKAARIADLERETELLKVMVNTLMVEKLVAVKEDIKKGKTAKEHTELLSVLLKLTSYKKGNG